MGVVPRKVFSSFEETFFLRCSAPSSPGLRSLSMPALRIFSKAQIHTQNEENTAMQPCGINGWSLGDAEAALKVGPATRMQDVSKAKTSSHVTTSPSIHQYPLGSQAEFGTRERSIAPTGAFERTRTSLTSTSRLLAINQATISGFMFMCCCT